MWKTPAMENSDTANQYEVLSSFGCPYMQRLKIIVWPTHLITTSVDFLRRHSYHAQHAILDYCNGLSYFFKYILCVCVYMSLYHLYFWYGFINEQVDPLFNMFPLFVSQLVVTDTAFLGHCVKHSHLQLQCPDLFFILMN